MTTQLPKPTGQFGLALVAIHRTSADTGLLAYVAALLRTGVISDIVCIHILPDTTESGIAGEQDRILAEMKGDVQRLLGLSATSAQVSFEVRHGTLVDSLLEAATDLKAEVVVIGHRQDHPLRRSLARRLAKLAPCSIWLVPDGTPPAITRILVGIDFSPTAAHTLQTATALAARVRIPEVTAVHVYFDESRTTYEGAEAGIRGQEEAAFAAFISPLDTTGVRVVPVFREGVHPADAIGRVAAEQSVDLVVMGTRGRSSSAAFLLGSVAEETLVASRVPVLVLKAPGPQVGLFRALLERLSRHEPGAQFD